MEVQIHLAELREGRDGSAPDNWVGELAHDSAIHVGDVGDTVPGQFIPLDGASPAVAVPVKLADFNEGITHHLTFLEIAVASGISLGAAGEDVTGQVFRWPGDAGGAGVLVLAATQAVEGGPASHGLLTVPVTVSTV